MNCFVAQEKSPFLLWNCFDILKILNNDSVKRNYPAFIYLIILMGCPLCLVILSFLNGKAKDRKLMLFRSERKLLECCFMFFKYWFCSSFIKLSFHFNYQTLLIVYNNYKRISSKNAKIKIWHSFITNRLRCWPSFSAWEKLNFENICLRSSGNIHPCFWNYLHSICSTSVIKNTKSFSWYICQLVTVFSNCYWSSFLWWSF